jgi:uncharacterized protein YdeI (YjbR/CyaY-like superfamily)
MAPITPNPQKIKSFRTEAAFEAWLRRNHARETEVWLKIFKKGSGVPSISSAEALDVVLCETLGRRNLFALAYRTNSMRTPAGRAKKIAALVAMLARGETIFPDRR